MKLCIAPPLSFSGIVISGFFCLLLSYLIFRSGFLPRWPSPLVALAGFGWLTFLWPSFAKHLAPIPMILGILGEGALTVCLLVTRTKPQLVEDEHNVRVLNLLPPQE